MSGLALVIAAIVLLLCLFALGVPVVIAFLLCDLLGSAVITGSAGFGMVANSILDTTNIADLSAIPLLILLGELLFRSYS